MDRLNPKPVKGRVKVLKAIPYKGHMMYIRMIGKDYFEYLVVYNSEVYSSYIIITPKKGKGVLNKKEIAECMGMISAGAEATIDMLVGEVKEVDEKVKRVIETVEVMEKRGNQ